MKKRRGSATEEDKMVDEALQKASRLIALLQRDNQDHQQQKRALQQELVEVKNVNQQLNVHSSQLESRLKVLQEQYDKLKSEQGMSSLVDHDHQLQKKSAANKELHEKVGKLTGQVKEMTQQLNEVNKKYLSLQNQNEYLIKKLQKNEDHESKLQQIAGKVQQKEVTELRKLKQAFSRRCEQLKAQNSILRQKAAEYKQMCIDGKKLQPPKIITPDPPMPTPPADSPLPNMLKDIIKQYLGITPQGDLEKQLEQLSSFLSYRLEHLERMCQSIMTKLEIREWKSVENLKDLQFACHRLDTYVAEMLATMAAHA